MPKLRLVVSLCLFALTAACSPGSGYSDIPATMTSATLTSPWPEFLPIEDILQSDGTMDELNEAVIRTLQFRVALLNKKAAILRDNTLSEQQRIRRMSALLRPAG